MKSGIAISTYFDETTHRDRLQIYRECMMSLKASKYTGEIVIVDDCSKVRDHYDASKGFYIHTREKNGGTGLVKNTSIRLLLEAGCDTLFLSDDDMIFRNGWAEAYIDAMKTMKIPHMAYVCKHMQQYQEVYCGVRIIRTTSATANGCFLAINKTVIDEIGGFKRAAYFYGHSHENFSLRCLKFGLIPFYCDLANRDEFIQLNNKSHDAKSRKIDMTLANSGLQVLVNINKVEPIIE